LTIDFTPSLNRGLGEERSRINKAWLERVHEIGTCNAFHCGLDLVQIEQISNGNFSAEFAQCFRSRVFLMYKRANTFSRIFQRCDGGSACSASCAGDQV